MAYNIVLIDKQTSEVHKLNGVVHPIEVTESNEKPSATQEFNVKLKVKMNRKSKKAWRDFAVKLGRPHLACKREIVDILFRDFGDKDYFHKLTKEEYLKMSRKNLCKYYSELCMARHNDFFTKPPLPKGKSEDTYFPDPTKLLKQ